MELAYKKSAAHAAPWDGSAGGPARFACGGRAAAKRRSAFFNLLGPPRCVASWGFSPARSACGRRLVRPLRRLTDLRAAKISQSPYRRVR
jgi:hypothetical protein